MEPQYPPNQPQQPNPADQQQYPQTPLVYVSRPHGLQGMPIPPEIQQKHEDSKRKYPNLNLSNGEYVISAVRRHPIGIIQIWAVIALLTILLGGMAVLFKTTAESMSFDESSGSFGDLLAILFPALTVLFIVGGLIATYVYVSNKFFLTNESVIQEIQHSLFSRHEQTVSLANIEDASYRQDGILPHILNYGSIRLSTEGDETTYRFSYVSSPKKHIAILNNAVEAYKNGRPVAEED